MKKDKVTYLLVFALFFVYVILIIIAFYNIDNLSQVNSSAVNDVNIVLDAGHGGEDGGAVANGIIEKNINLAITSKLADIFRAYGFNVRTTRDSDTMFNAEGESIRDKKQSDMRNRLNLFNERENNIIISIHQNKFIREKYSGTQIFYSAGRPESKMLAESIKNNVVALIQPGNTREIKKADNGIYLLYNAKVPAVIVECGFISNIEESKKLKSDEYQNKIAFTVFSGFLDYYNN